MERRTSHDRVLVWVDPLREGHPLVSEGNTRSLEDEPDLLPSCGSIEVNQPPFFRAGERSRHAAHILQWSSANTRRFVNGNRHREGDESATCRRLGWLGWLVRWLVGGLVGWWWLVSWLAGMLMVIGSDYHKARNIRHIHCR